MLKMVEIHDNTIICVLFLFRIRMFQRLTCNQFLGIVNISLVCVNLHATLQAYDL